MSKLPPPLRKLPLPVIGSPLFIVSTPATVIAQCKAGVLGTMPTLNARPAAQLDEWLDEIAQTLAAHDRTQPERPAAPFGVNLIVHKSNDRLDADLATVVRHRVPIVITSLGALTEVNEAIRGYGGVVLHDVINDSFARKAIEKGADGLIAVACGAGGHAGTTSPFALVQEIRRWFDGPLVLGGAIATGAAVLAAQVMGADFAYIGSAFIATLEARAKEAYKQAIVDGASTDIVYTNLFTGVHGNYLKPSILRAGLDPENLPQRASRLLAFDTERQQHKWQALEEAQPGHEATPTAPPDSAAKAWKDVWGCGQGIGAVTEVLATEDFVARLRHEYETARRRLHGEPA